jgi:succinylarginine dihydrolase
MKAYEVNFDAIVGPTHNYAGLAYGNVASQKSRHSVSNPREAALEGLAKMKFLADLGVRQAVLPPQLRPDLSLLRSVGYHGSDAHVLEAVQREDPALLAAASSASAMWAANAATVSPSADCAEGRVHFSPANLISQVHRSIEAPATAAVLRAIFPDPAHFVHHPLLPCHPRWADEGAANHTRLCGDYGDGGVEIFVFGRPYASPSASGPKTFPARQTDQASHALARRHQLSRAIFIQQNPAAIDAGVFHNDVACVGNQNVLLCHEEAFLEQANAITQIRSACPALQLIQVSGQELTLAEAVETYLFNSQIVTLPDGSMSLIAPSECERHPRARAVADRVLAANTPIRSVHFVSVRQSMRNGGGPACLRLRVVLSETELTRTHAGMFLDDALYALLVDWVNKYYREELRPEDLADVKLLEEGRAALEELGRILTLKLV